MTDAHSKIHPATREILPNDPMELSAVELPGDPALMLRLLVEEYARMGWAADAILQLARDPHYRAFHGLSQYFGWQEFESNVRETLGRCGVMRVKTTESPQHSEKLVQIDLGTARVAGDDHLT